jgi:16S rRNA (adenine1518-N6/adenine1519-N6)-dimethyltransferase
MLAPKKSLGQNFLRDENVARNIVESLGLDSDDVVFEIGPGQGALTKHLSSRAKRILAVEVDERAIKVLRETLAESVRLIHADVLQVSLGSLAREYKARLRVVGNIPYNITSEILFWLFDSCDAVQDATLMVQLEVARRFVAQPGTKEYGILSVFSRFYSSPEYLFKVSRNSFYPKPNVDSAVVRFRFRPQPLACNRELFKAVVRGTFSKRRKTLRNGLRYMGFSDDQLEAVTFELTRRPEDLTLEDFLKLTKELEPFSEFRAENPPSLP